MKTPLFAAALLMVMPAADALANPPATRPAGPAVVVHLRSGRTFSGQVDPQTDEREFVLQTCVGPGLIQRPIQWDRLVWAEIVGQQISGPELQRLVTEILRSVTPPTPQPPRPTIGSAAPSPRPSVVQGSRTARAI